MNKIFKITSIYPNYISQTSFTSSPSEKILFPKLNVFFYKKCDIFLILSFDLFIKFTNILKITLHSKRFKIKNSRILVIFINEKT